MERRDAISRAAMPGRFIVPSSGFWNCRPQTRLLMCHDYAPGGRAYAFETTVAKERAQNIHAHDGVTEDAFVARRTARDATLDTPRLFLPSLQVNVRAGELPPPESNGRRYFKIPIEAPSFRLDVAAGSGH
jgi:hypothetical protein